MWLMVAVRKMAHKKDKDVNAFYKSECKILVISRDIISHGILQVRGRCRDVRCEERKKKYNCTRLYISGQFNK